MLDRRQANGFQALADLAFREFDAAQVEDRQRVAKAINQLSVDASRQCTSKNLPSVLRGIAELAQHVGNEDFEALKSTLKKASSDLDDAIKWANRRQGDTLLRLKAVAAAHFADCQDPLCPLCQQPIKGPEHRGLVEDLRILKTDAEKAQSQLGDVCRRIEQEIRSAAQDVVPDEFMRVGRFAVKRNIQDHVRSTFVEVELTRFGGHLNCAQGGVRMTRGKAPYAAEYRQQMVELVRGGRRPMELAREFECSASAIRNWVRQADRDEGLREDGLTTAEREELRRLRRENRQLREEREILKKAAAWFARETGTVPGRSSRS